MQEKLRRHGDVMRLHKRCESLLLRYDIVSFVTLHFTSRNEQKEYEDYEDVAWSGGGRGYSLRLYTHINITLP
jgi:hypothetical protein